MDGRERRRFCARVRLLTLGLLLGSAGVVVRAIQLQVHGHEELARLARSQYLNDVQVPARRGNIYDRNGKPLAISVDVPSVFANPAAITDARAAARALAKALDLDLDVVYQKLASDRLFVWLKRQVSPEAAARVEALGLEGIGITQEPKRFYPNRELAAHVLGFTDVDGRGLEGIERALEEELAGEPQVVAVERDGRGRALLSGRLDPSERSRGADVHLTLDAQIQHAAEAALKRTVQGSKALSGVSVVLDVASAEILAIAVEPHFNPNVASEATPERRRNRALTDVFEPGSSMKPLVIAAALEAGAVRPDALIFCENGVLQIGNHAIHDHEHAAGWLSLSRIIEKSSNIGAAKVGQALGRERLGIALQSYGFGQRIGLRFPGEVPGILREPRTWSEIGLANISFGHGIAVTALQLAAAYRTLASDGLYKSPRLTKSVGEVGSVESPAIERRVLSTSTVRRVRSMLEAAVSPEGTGHLAVVPGFRVAGKTGTAQKIDAVDGGYSSDDYVAVFAGFLPAQAPRVVIVVAIDDPEGAHTGGLVAAPVFAEIGAAAMQALGVVPTEPLPAVADAAPPATAGANDAALATGVTAARGGSAGSNGSAIAEGEGVASDVTAPAATSRAAIVPAKASAIPSFVGLTAREVAERYRRTGEGLQLHMTGTGRVVRQEPAPGSDRSSNARVSLTLSE